MTDPFSVVVILVMIFLASVFVTNFIIQSENRIMSRLDDLEAEITDTENAETAAIQLLEALHADLEAAGTDPTKLAQLRDELKAKTDALAAAIVANTPADPANPAPEPAPPSVDTGATAGSAGDDAAATTGA